MVSPRILLYVGLAGLGWTFLRRYWQRKQDAPKHAPIVEDGVVPGVDRKGDDAVCRVTITADEARAGKLVTVPSIEGPQQIQVPSGVKDGARLRLARLGFRRPDGKRGDQYVVVSVSG